MSLACHRTYLRWNKHNPVSALFHDFLSFGPWRRLPAHLDHAEDAMQPVLEFPSKIFIQWGAIAQEIVPYLAQRGVKKEEIRAVVERLRTKWEQLDPAPFGQGADIETHHEAGTVQVSGSLEERAMYASRHWRSQPARTLIESALADYQRHTQS